MRIIKSPLESKHEVIFMMKEYRVTAERSTSVTESVWG